jgi:hypothetical protein
MSKDKRSDTTKDTTTPDAKATRSTETTPESVMAKETARGFRGIEVDPTPNENYTVAGVTSKAPTPETDAGLAADVRKETGLGLSALEAAEREKKQRGEK